MTLVVGGASSGKSAVGLSLAEKGTKRRARKAFVATAQALDPEMGDKIRLHQSERDSSWTTEEVPLELVAWFQDHGNEYATIVLDCVTLWLSNLAGQGLGSKDIVASANDLVRAIQAGTARVVLVTNEIGLGLVPMEGESRRFRDLTGRINQLLAAQADDAYFVVSGLKIRIK